MLILAALLTALLSLGKFADIPSIRTSTFGKGLGLRWRLSSEIKRLLLTKHLTMLSAQQKLYKLHAIARKRDLQNYTNFRIRIRIWNADPAPGAGISTKINNLHQVYFTSKNLTFFDNNQNLQKKPRRGGGGRGSISLTIIRNNTPTDHAPHPKCHTALIKNLISPLTLLQPLNAHPCCSTYGTAALLVACCSPWMLIPAYGIAALLVACPSPWPLIPAYGIAASLSACCCSYPLPNSSSYSSWCSSYGIAALL